MGFAGDLDPGDRIVSGDLSRGTVDSLVEIEGEQIVYNITVDEAHTFFVGEGEWLVHNHCNPQTYDWEHIFDRHAGWGNVAQQRLKADPDYVNDIFSGLTEDQIRARVKAAVENTNRKRMETLTQWIDGREIVRIRYRAEDPVSGRLIEYWYNQTDRILETAYPVGP